MMFVDFFLRLSMNGKQSYSCPDILYHTQTDSTYMPPSIEQWLELLKKWELLAMSIDVGPIKVHQFSCNQIGLKCNPMEQTKSGMLVPWCCMYAANHIVRTMNRVVKETGTLRR